MQHGVFLKMSILRDVDGHTRAVGYTSRNGIDWGCSSGNCDFSVDFGVLDGPLGWQGIGMVGNSSGIHEFYFQNPELKISTGATTMYDDPNDGTVAFDRQVRAYDIPFTFGNGSEGDFGEGLGGGYGL